MQQQQPPPQSVLIHPFAALTGNSSSSSRYDGVAFSSSPPYVAPAMTNPTRPRPHISSTSLVSPFPPPRETETSRRSVVGTPIAVATTATTTNTAVKVSPFSSREITTNQNEKNIRLPLLLRLVDYDNPVTRRLTKSDDNNNNNNRKRNKNRNSSSKKKTTKNCTTMTSITMNNSNNNNKKNGSSRSNTIKSLPRRVSLDPSSNDNKDTYRSNHNMLMIADSSSKALASSSTTTDTVTDTATTVDAMLISLSRRPLKKRKREKMKKEPAVLSLSSSSSLTMVARMKSSSLSDFEDNTGAAVMVSRRVKRTGGPGSIRFRHHDDDDDNDNNASSSSLSSSLIMKKCQHTRKLDDTTSISKNNIHNNNGTSSKAVEKVTTKIATIVTSSDGTVMALGTNTYNPPASLPPFYLQGTLSYNTKARQHVIRGMWNYEDDASSAANTFPPQKFEWCRNVVVREDDESNEEDDSDNGSTTISATTHSPTTDGNFHGSFVYTYDHLTKKGKHKIRSKLIPEWNVTIIFTILEEQCEEMTEDDDDSCCGARCYIVEGTGENQFGKFHIHGTATPSSSTTQRDADDTHTQYCIELMKSYDFSIAANTTIAPAATTAATSVTTIIKVKQEDDAQDDENEYDYAGMTTAQGS